MFASIVGPGPRQPDPKKCLRPTVAPNGKWTWRSWWWAEGSRRSGVICGKGQENAGDGQMEMAGRVLWSPVDQTPTPMYSWPIPADPNLDPPWSNVLLGPSSPRSLPSALSSSSRFLGPFFFCPLASCADWDLRKKGMAPFRAVSSPFPSHSSFLRLCSSPFSVGTLEWPKRRRICRRIWDMWGGGGLGRL